MSRTDKYLLHFKKLTEEIIQRGGFKEGSIHGLRVIPLQRYEDARGALLEIYRKDWTIRHKPVMAYISYTLPHQKRGPHLHLRQSDYFVFAGPGNFLFRAWDLRKSSSSFGKFVNMVCGMSNPCAVRVPPGVAHGYSNPFEEPAWSVNLPDKLYKGKKRKKLPDEVRFENSELEALLFIPTKMETSD